MENRPENETGPAKKRQSFRISLEASDSKQSSPEMSSNASTILNEQQARDNVAPLLQRLLAPSPENIPDCIILSSDEEMEDDEENGNMEEMILPDSKIVEVDEPPSKSDSVDAKRNFVNKRSFHRNNEAGDSEQQPPKICKYCGRLLKSKKTLSQHIRRRHKSLIEPLIFKCETCGKEMSREHCLKFHQVMHTKERLFGCDLCKKKYKSQFYLNVHLKSQQHKCAEALKMSKESDPLSEDSLLVEDNDEVVSSTSLLTGNPIVAGSSRSVTSIGTSPPPFAEILETTSKCIPTPASVTPSTSQIEVANYAPQQASMNISTAIASNGVTNFSMIPHVQGMAAPVMFYGYIGQTDGAFFPRNACFPAIQPPQYALAYSGMSNFMHGMAPQHSLQQLKYQMNPHGFVGHPQQSTSAPLFTCSECQGKFSVEAHLRSHMREVHSNECWKCPKCLSVMLSPTELQQHFIQCNM